MTSGVEYELISQGKNRCYSVLGLNGLRAVHAGYFSGGFKGRFHVAYVNHRRFSVQLDGDQSFLEAAFMLRVLACSQLSCMKSPS